MTLKNATFFAIVGVAVWTILLAVDFVVKLSGVARGFIAADALLASLIQFVAVLSLLVFFVVFRRSQS
jgi:hypothetical protein